MLPLPQHSAPDNCRPDWQSDTVFPDGPQKTIAQHIPVPGRFGAVPCHSQIDGLSLENVVFTAIPLPPCQAILCRLSQTLAPQAQKGAEPFQVPRPQASGIIQF